MGVPAKSLNYLPVYVGVAQDIFAEEGLDVEVTVMPAEVSIAGLVSGSLDYSGASTAAIRANMAGAGVRSLAFMSIQPTFYIMSRPELRSLADLRGKIVATTSLGSSTTEVARTAVSRAGLDPNNDIQILATGNTANAYTTLLSGQADAAVLSVPYNVQAERDGYYPLLYAGDVTSSPESGLAASVEKLRREPDQVRRMLRGILKGLRYVRERKPETTALIVREFEVAPDLADGAYETMLRSYSRDGLIPNSTLEETMATHAAQTGLAQPPAVEDVTDYGPLREAQRELGL
jgi:NitT/TauT family transport system substrate-binding protein